MRLILVLGGVDWENDNTLKPPLHDAALLFQILIHHVTWCLTGVCFLYDVISVEVLRCLSPAPSNIFFPSTSLQNCTNIQWTKSSITNSVMGQHHQIFVIARINDCYRGLAAVHLEAFFGRGLPSECESLIAIFKSPSTVSALFSELTFGKTLPQSFWEDNDESDEDEEGETRELLHGQDRIFEHPF